MDKNKNQRKSEEVLLSGAQCSGPALPVRNPHVTPIILQHLKMQSRRLFSHWSLFACVWAHMRSSQAVSPPSLDKNYIIAACDLISLKEHFEVAFPFFIFLFPLCITCLNVTMTHIKSPSTPPVRYAIPQCNSSLLNIYECMCECFRGVGGLVWRWKTVVDLMYHTYCILFYCKKYLVIFGNK